MVVVGDFSLADSISVGAAGVSRLHFSGKLESRQVLAVCRFQLAASSILLPVRYIKTKLGVSLLSGLVSNFSILHSVIFTYEELQYRTNQVYETVRQTDCSVSEICWPKHPKYVGPNAQNIFLK